MVFCPIYISTATTISKNYGFVYSSDNTWRAAGRTSGDLYRLFAVFKYCTGLYIHSDNGYCGGTEFHYNKRYNVLLSGFKGEKSLMKTVKKLGNEYTVFANVPVRYKKNRSEIDLLVLCERYIIIIEVKNHSGYIYGNHKDEKWTQRKIYRGGKTTETDMTNPIRQMRRQRDIIKSILRANDLDQWVDTVLYFSAPTVHLYLDLNDSDNVCSSEKELLEFLRTYRSPKPIDPGKLEKIKLLFKEMCSNK